METAEEMLSSYEQDHVFNKNDVLFLMKHFSNKNIFLLSHKSEEMIYEKKSSKDKKDGLVLRNFQTTYAVPK